MQLVVYTYHHISSKYVIQISTNGDHAAPDYETERDGAIYSH